MVAGAEDHGGGLLGLALYRHEAHGRALRGLADCFRISRIVLLTLHEWLHIGRRDQSDGMAKLADLAGPMMSAWAGFHRDKTRRLGREEAQNLLAPQLLTKDRRAGGIRAVA